MAAVKLSRYRQAPQPRPKGPLAKVVDVIARDPGAFERRRRWLVEFERRLTTVRPELTGKVDFADALGWFRAGIPIGIAVTHALAALLPKKRG